ncbi:finTRIM family, member 16 [Silurus asotus]|uniref:FinTRIM family, member 16 n=1 Tax=Silurus asotus TaxID=30991 RepID=A0AAD5AD77_SILAS|nr:finTRIM family, member 16 [Silurus asotus]
MAEASISVNQDQFICAVCLDLLKDPVAIPCGHSYCKGCINGCWNQEDMKSIYSCPQCRETFTPRPVLRRNNMLAEVVEKLKKTELQAASPAHCYAGPADVDCDFCTEGKHKAVKSCLVCLASYCENHLKPHYQSQAFKKHKLVEACVDLQEKICPQHDKLMEIYCRTDQSFICYLCMMDKHKGHDTVSTTAERSKKQNELKEEQIKSQQRIQEKQRKVQELKQTVDTIKDQFICAVCLDLLKDPVTIPCGHSYCKGCINGFWNQEDIKSIYSCPQCRETFTPRPVLRRNNMLAEVVEKLKKTELQAASPAHCYAGPGDVDCDSCIGKKHKAVKSCLVCLASYCEDHLKPHYQSQAFKKHKLVEACVDLQEKICSQHDKLMEIYCRTDQSFICYLCMTDEHKGHDTVSTTAERSKKQLTSGLKVLLKVESRHQVPQRTMSHPQVPHRVTACLQVPRKVMLPEPADSDVVVPDSSEGDTTTQSSPEGDFLPPMATSLVEGITQSLIPAEGVTLRRDSAEGLAYPQDSVEDTGRPLDSTIGVARSLFSVMGVAPPPVSFPVHDPDFFTKGFALFLASAVDCDPFWTSAEGVVPFQVSRVCIIRFRLSTGEVAPPRVLLGFPRFRGDSNRVPFDPGQMARPSSERPGPTGVCGSGAPGAAPWGESCDRTAWTLPLQGVPRILHSMDCLDDNEKIFNEMISSLVKRRSELTEMIRVQEKAELNRAERFLKHLEQEITDLQRRFSDLEQLSHTPDHIHFLQSFPSLCVSPGCDDSPSFTVNQHLSFDELKNFVSNLKKRVEEICQEEFNKICPQRITFWFSTRAPCMAVPRSTEREDTIPGLSGGTFALLGFSEGKVVFEDPVGSPIVAQGPSDSPSWLLEPSGSHVAVPDSSEGDTTAPSPSADDLPKLTSLL